MHKILYVRCSEEQTDDSVYSEKKQHESLMLTMPKKAVSVPLVRNLIPQVGFMSGSALRTSAVASSFYCAQLFL